MKKMNKIKTLTAVLLAALMIAPAMAQSDKGLALPADPADKNITPRPTSAQATIYNIAPSPSYNSPLSVSVWVNHQNNTYRIGDKILITVQAKRDGYLTLISTNAVGESRVIFPNRFQSNTYLRKGQMLTIPNTSSNFDFVVSGPTGTELIKAFITSQPTNLLKDVPLNNDDFPLVQLSTQALAKNIDTVVRHQQQSGNDWGAYNKLIYIIPANGSSYVPPSNNGPSNAQQAEYALHLNGAQIRSIQRYLRQLGYYKGSVDGVIGSQTRQAILRWQRDVGLSPTGYIDSESFARVIQ